MATTNLVITSSAAPLATGSTRDITVECRDADGLLVSGDSTTSVTVTATGTGSATGSGAATAASGIATVTLTAVKGGPISLAATATSVTSGFQTFEVIDKNHQQQHRPFGVPNRNYPALNP